ncbi:type II toxin-antitoxin system RelE/ParE family toxin [Patescibacteria group bacterium]|nr:type II toxin-antitoxin system RelE/ParE family toxin [Patescibacteria group bacterium]MBU4017350.1 type II toxin-antitoxin system RelE/ParE family toxin [Patescibacteria group bacterium]MBU4099114.1 type II toxin-antitoxin system RelE/ParE family toxin [Patescibacteria group bacterium]
MSNEWKILFYETKSGESPVYEFFKQQQAHGRSKITHLIDLLSKYGNALGLPHSKAMGSGLYEMRIRGKEELRIFYCFTKQKTIYLLHAFKKQGQRTPKKEFGIAAQRKEEIKSV